METINPWQGIKADPYSDPSPQMVAAKERMKFQGGAPGGLSNYFQNLLYGGQSQLPWWERGFNQIIQNVIPENPMEVIPTAGTLKRGSSFLKSLWGKLRSEPGEAIKHIIDNRPNAEIKKFIKPEPKNELPPGHLQKTGKSIDDVPLRDEHGLTKFERKLGDQILKLVPDTTGELNHLDLKRLAEKGMGDLKVNVIFNGDTPHEYSRTMRVREINRRISEGSMRDDNFMELEAFQRDFIRKNPTHIERVKDNVLNNLVDDPYGYITSYDVKKLSKLGFDDLDVVVMDGLTREKHTFKMKDIKDLEKFEDKTGISVRSVWIKDWRKRKK